MEETPSSPFKSPIFYSAIFAIIISSIGYYFISYKPNHKEKIESQKNPSIVVNTAKETDSDNDGLPDWKEIVYGSDSSKKDTDLDGINDGDEINMGHDPTKPGPDDILHNLILKNGTSTGSATLEQTFVAEFMSKEIENAGSETVSGLLKQLDLSKIKPRYGLTDLNITSDNSEASLRKYADTFGIIIKKYLSSETEDEAVIMARAIETKRESDLQKIELPAITYRNFAEDLRKLETPSLVAEHHLNIVSGYDVMSRSLMLTTKLFTNPLEGSAGWQTYIANMVTVTRGYAGVINVLHTKSIKFEKGDAGYYFRWRAEENSTTTTQQKK